ncbi:hypothetical protein [Desulfovibrio sp. MES5]
MKPSHWIYHSVLLLCKIFRISVDHDALLTAAFRKMDKTVTIP